VCYPGWYGCWVYDGVSGIFVEDKGKMPIPAAIHPGTILEIDGVSGPGGFQPILDEAVSQIVGTGPLPTGPEAEPNHISTGDYDGQWVTFECTVRSANIVHDSISFRKDPVLVVVSFGPLAIQRRNALCSAGAVCPAHSCAGPDSAAGGALVNNRLQTIWRAMYAPSIEGIEVLKAAPNDLFSLPRVSISKVFDVAPGSAVDNPVKVHGIVTAQWDRSVFLRDGEYSASILSADSTSLAPGELVDAVGYLALGETIQTLDDTIFKRHGMASPPEPRLLKLNEVTTWDFADQLVRINGRLIQLERDGDQDTLLVAVGATVFSAILPHSLNQPPLGNLKPGSEIQLTGVCRYSSFGEGDLLST
jgi:hypothetical protein